MPKPPTSSRKQAKGELRARTTAPRPPKPTRAACRAAEAIRTRGSAVGAELGLLPPAERAGQLPAFRLRLLAICADERSALGEGERDHDVVVAAARQMEKALARLAAAAEPAGRAVRRGAAPAALARQASREGGRRRRPRGSAAAPAASLLAAREAQSRRAPMDLGKLVDEAEDVDSLKADAEELKDIATGDGSVVDKAKAAAEGVKEAGEAGPGR